MTKRKTKEDFAMEIYKLVGEEYIVVGEYINAHTFILLQHGNHQFKVRPTDFLQGKRCNLCEKQNNKINNSSKVKTHKLRRTEEEFIKEIFDLVGSEYTILSPFVTTKIKVKIRHNICNHTYEVEPRDFFKGRRCPKCAGNKRKTTNEFKEEIYSLVKDEYIVLDEYVNDKTKLLIKHMVCSNEYLVKPNDFLNGYGRCRNCLSHKEYVLIKNNSTKKTNKKANSINNKTTKKRITEKKVIKYFPYSPPYEKSLGYLYPELIEEWSTKNLRNTYQVYSQSSKKAWWKCKKCGHEWETRVSTRTSKQKSGCPLCNESKGEKRVRYYLETNSITFIPQKDFKGLVGTGGGNLFYDFYLPKQNILIEYQGKQHIEFVKMIHIEKENFLKQLEHDNRKREYAKANNINLLEIWYWDYEKVEEILNKELLINCLTLP